MQHSAVRPKYGRWRDYLRVPKLGAPFKEVFGAPISLGIVQIYWGANPSPFHQKARWDKTGQNRMAVLFRKFPLMYIVFGCYSTWVGKGPSLAFRKVVDQPKRSSDEKVMAQTVQHGSDGRGASGIKWALAQIYSKYSKKL